MLTYHEKYMFNPAQLPFFEIYIRRWMSIVNRWGAIHHGYFMPAVINNNIAYCLLSFESVRDFESFHYYTEGNKLCIKLARQAASLGFIVSRERNFMDIVEYY